MGRPSRLIVSLRAAIKQRISQDLRPDNFELPKPPTLEEHLERRRSELRNGLTDRQRLFLFGKLSGLNDKNAALAAGYALSVAENTKQRLWKPQVRTAATVQGLTRAVPIGFRFALSSTIIAFASPFSSVQTCGPQKTRTLFQPKAQGSLRCPATRFYPCNKCYRAPGILLILKSDGVSGPTSPVFFQPD